MTNHSALLRQIRADARPYIEQWLEIGEVFSGFRKLAAENDLDWGVIKALIKAEVQDEQEGGSKKVERIIEKADCASAYADMLGLGGGDKINFSSEPASSFEPAHDPTTGELIDDVPAHGPATAPVPGAGGITPAKDDVGEGTDQRPALSDASSTLSHPAAGAAEQDLGAAPTSVPGSDFPISAVALPPADKTSGVTHSGEWPDIPPQFDRRRIIEATT